MVTDRNITFDELIVIMESKSFKSTFKDRKEHPIFSFKEGYIGRDGIKFGRYSVTKNGDKFHIRIFETDEVIFTDIYRDIVIVIKEDNRFPISLNFSQGSQDIIFEETPAIQEL